MSVYFVGLCILYSLCFYRIRKSKSKYDGELSLVVPYPAFTCISAFLRLRLTVDHTYAAQLPQVTKYQFSASRDREMFCGQLIDLVQWLLQRTMGRKLTQDFNQQRFSGEIKCYFHLKYFKISTRSQEPSAILLTVNFQI